MHALCWRYLGLRVWSRRYLVDGCHQLALFCALTETFSLYADADTAGSCDDSGIGK